MDAAHPAPRLRSDPRPHGTLRWSIAAGLLLASVLGTDVAAAQVTRLRPEGQLAPPPTLLGTIDALKIESAVVLTSATYAGLKAWGWGTRSFHFKSEGWFGMNTPHGGADKCGHMYMTYFISELFYLRLNEYYGRRRVVSLYPALLAFAIMTYVEVSDGFSVDHGSSPEDFTMDALGAGFAAVRNALPPVRDALDLRFEYLPSKSVHGLHPFKDYSGQKFFAVLKPAGLGPLYYTPLRYVEFSLGYSARGFKPMDTGHYAERTREVFVGVGLSVDQLLLARLERQVGTPFNYVRAASRWFQVPYSYLPFTVDERSAPGQPPR